MLAFEESLVRFPGAEVGPLTLRLPRGAFVAVVGPAAAGKSVLLKLACGLQRVSAGRVLLDGVVIGERSPAELRTLRAKIGMVFQNDALFDHLRVLENVALPLLRRGVPADEARTRAARALADVGLEAAMEKRPAELSGGMKKRVGVARAVVGRPELALYDEPTAGLDPATTRRILELVSAQHARLGGLTIVAGADPSPLFPRADLAIVLDEGKIVAFGPPAQVYARPEVRALFELPAEGAA